MGSHFGDVVQSFELIGSEVHLRAIHLHPKNKVKDANPLSVHQGQSGSCSHQGNGVVVPYSFSELVVP